MQIHILTLFPEFVQSYFRNSIIGKACDSGILELHVLNIRDFATNTYGSCDDEPYGGGFGMLLSPEPLAAALDSLQCSNALTIFPTPVAPLFTQENAHELSTQSELVFICGKYEGIDQRIIDIYVDRVYSIGEYVIASGELASMVILDASLRLMEGMITQGSLEEESYTGNLLEYPQYTRPQVFQGHKVPDILLSGDHARIAEWRRQERVLNTRKHRPDLLEK